MNYVFVLPRLRIVHKYGLREGWRLEKMGGSEPGCGCHEVQHMIKLWCLTSRRFESLFGLSDLRLRVLKASHALRKWAEGGREAGESY